LPVTPINPVSKAINARGEEHSTVASLSALPNPKDTSISVITPPSVTLEALKEAKELGVPAVWMQPGAFDAEVLKFANDNFKAVVAGEGGWGDEGWCVLVDGERGLKAVGKL
jgi:predicted CoA-binding protein